MMINKPLVSILVPVYNAQAYIEECILSLLGQSYKNIEIIIINDGSTDNTVNILSKFEGDSRIIIIEQSNKGIVYALNNAISAAKGVYIARMDADDISHPERISKQVEFLEFNQDYILCGSYVKWFGNEERLIKYPIEDLEIKSDLFFRSSICHPAVMIRTNVLNEVKYEQEFLYAEDYRLWTLLSMKGKFYNLPIALLNYRVHPNQTSELKREKQIKAHIKVSKNYISTFGVEVGDGFLYGLLFSDSLLKFIINVTLSLRLLFVLPNKRAFLVPFKMFLRRYAAK